MREDGVNVPSHPLLSCHFKMMALLLSFMYSFFPSLHALIYPSPECLLSPLLGWPLDFYIHFSPFLGSFIFYHSPAVLVQMAFLPYERRFLLCPDSRHPSMENFVNFWCRGDQGRRGIWTQIFFQEQRLTSPKLWVDWGWKQHCYHDNEINSIDLLGIIDSIQEP